ncbi:Hypothetical_protein [Hexamita inflata]|uniref:Hypothetical_protein n=1 Tax=Hexamita inflata TaxID=28002 RepID=A0AA86U5Y1_9EUKA|nr:Hypothetical protein HINF_LOCUS19158 [Hexamita inflata]
MIALITSVIAHCTKQILLSQCHEVQLLHKPRKSVLGEQSARTQLEEIKAIFVIYIESFNIQQFSCSIEAANNREYISSQFNYFQIRNSNSTWLKLSIVWFQSELFTCIVKVNKNFTQISGVGFDIRYHVSDISQLDYLPIRLVLMLGLFTGHGITTIMKLMNEHELNIIIQQYHFTKNYIF